MYCSDSQDAAQGSVDEDETDETDGEFGPFTKKEMDYWYLIQEAEKEAFLNQKK